MRRLILAFVATLAASALIAPAAATAADPAADYPNKPVRLVVPFPPGGTTDLIARILSEHLSRELKQTVVVDNRGGAGGAIGAAEVAKASADGYTLGMATASTHSINPVVQPKLAYDALRDFTPISQIAAVPNVLIVGPHVKAASVKELISLAQANPGKVTYASPGNGSVGHFMGEAFKASAKVDLLHVPYRGAGQALNDFLGGVVDAMFDNLPTSLPHIRSGKARALAVASPTRVDTVPDVPTFAELGLRDVNEPAWFGLIAPAQLPPAIQDKLVRAVKATLAKAEVKERLTGVGATPVGSTPVEFAAHIRAELEKYRELARRAQLKFD